MESINVAGILQEAGMLTQGPAPDPKCKLNLWSFLTLPHLSDSLICTRSSMPIVLLLQMVGDGLGRGWLIPFSFCFVFFPLCVCPLFFHVLYPFFKWLEHDSCCVCFFVFYFFSLSLVPLTRSYWCIESVVSVM